MLDIKKLFGSFLLSLCKITKKTYTTGLIVVSAFTISVLLLGVNGFGYSSVEHESSYNNNSEDENDSGETEEELLLVNEADEAFSQIDDDTFSTQISENEAENVEVNEEGVQAVLAVVESVVVGNVVSNGSEADNTVTEEVVTEELTKEENLEKELVTTSLSNINLSDEDYDALLRIVEAEATSEDMIGKIMIANVVMNRVDIDRFPDSVYGVVHQKIKNRAQFSPIDDGRYYTVSISASTIEAVDRALAGEDYSNGALFFVARSLASNKAVSWFDRNLEKVAEHGCHEFYDYY